MGITPITIKDIEKYGMAICLIKMSMTPEQFDKWYAEELARQQARAREKAKKNEDGIGYAGRD